MTQLDPKLQTASAPPRRRYLPGGLARGLVGFTVGRSQRCPYCHDGLGEGEDLVACSACRAVYHRECLGPLGECMTFGCPHAPPAEEGGPPAPRRTRRLIVGLGLLLTGIALVILFGHPPWHDHGHDFPPPPPPPPAPVSSTILAPLHGQVVKEGEAVLVRGRLHLSEPWQSYPRSIGIYSKGRLIEAARVRSDLSFSAQLRLAPGPHHVQVRLPDRTHDVGVFVHATPRRPVVGSVAPQLDLTGTVRGTEAMVRGKLVGNGPVQVTVSGGGQSLTFEAQAPGPFASVLTLPRVGTHRIEVSVRDARGNLRSTVGTVRRVE